MAASRRRTAPLSRASRLLPRGSTASPPPPPPLPPRSPRPRSPARPIAPPCPRPAGAGRPRHQQGGTAGCTLLRRGARKWHAGQQAPCAPLTTEEGLPPGKALSPPARPPPPPPPPGQTRFHRWAAQTHPPAACPSRLCAGAGGRGGGAAPGEQPKRAGGKESRQGRLQVVAGLWLRAAAHLGGTQTALPAGWARSGPAP